MADDSSNSAKEKAKIIDEIRGRIEIKEENFVAWKVALETRDPFKILIATLLSQNTTDRNALKAFRRLEGKIGVEPEKLASAPLEEISEAIKVAGLYRVKAKALKDLSQIVLRKYGGSLHKLLNSKNPRKELLSLPRVGDKTADILLLIFKGENTIPVDTHIRRIALRLGVSDRDDYSSIQKGLMEYFKGENLLELHLYLIALGRTYCKPRRPRCSECPIADKCEYRLRNKI